MASMGDNELKVLNSLIDEIVDLETEKKGAKGDRSEEVKAMKAAKLPAAELVKLSQERRKDKEDVEAERERIRQAGALLGMVVYVAESDPLAAPEPGAVTLAQTGIRRVEALDEEIRLLSVEIKDRYNKVKGLGCDVKVVRRLVRDRINPEDDESRDEADGLFDTYKANLERVRKGKAEAVAEADDEFEEIP